MDLLSDETSGTRILTARHVLSDDKTLPETNNAINTSFLCHTYSLQPDFPTYLAALHSYAWVVWSCGFLLLLAICLLFAVTVKSVFRHRKNYSTNAICVLAVYPIVAGAAFLATIVPRTRILAEAIAQESVMIAMYHFFCMMIAECGGSDQLVSRAAGSRLETRVLPCCCWPCCVIPRPQIQKRNLKRLRYLVLQMPVIQTLIYVIILSLMSEDISVYLGSFMFIQPLVAASILTGVWGVIISVRAAEATGASPRPRFLALQLVLLIVKLQCALAKLLPELVAIPCLVPLNPSVFLNFIHNCVMILEMFLLSVWAWRLYRVPPGKTLEKAQQVVVAVLEDSPCVIDFKTNKGGVFNTGFDTQVNNRL